MPTSKADRLNKLFEGDSLPPPPDPNTPHIADTEIVPKMQHAQQPWAVPKVAQQPRRVARSPPRTGRDIEQLTSSDDDEYVRAFRKTPSIKSEIASKSRKNSSKDSSRSPAQHPGQRPTEKARSDGTDADQEVDDGVSQMDRDGNPLIGRFCPLMLVTKFCYKYMDDPNDRVSKHFFASGKIWNRTWDIYYIHPPASLFAKHILLVPEEQVQQLLNEINSTFHISIKIPGDPFLLAFYKDGTPAPSLLGTAQSREAVAEMEQKIPTPDENHGECPPGAGPEMEGSFQRFKEKMERAATISKKKSASAKKAKAKDRLTSHVKSFETLRRGQRYLGLRPQDRKGGLPVPDASLSWDEQQKFEREQKIKYGHILKPLGLEKPAPHPFNRDVVFVAIDVEAYERAHDLITEVGISTLDTVDIKNVEPGHGGFNWMERIRSRHFRIIENQHYINTDYCVGDPEKFLFGQSEFVSIKDIGKMVDSCFEPPYSGGCMHDGRFRPQDQQNCNKLEQSSQESAQEVPESPLQSEPVGTRGPDNAEEDQANKAAVSKLVTPSVSNEAVANGEAGSEGPLNNGQVDGVPAPDIEQAPIPLRNVILVGHNLEADLGYLSTLESKIFHKPPPVVYPQPLEPEDPLRQHILESLDTAKLYQVYQRESNTTSLNKVLVAVERTGWYLHNAGNDARYTLEAMIGILIRARLQEDEAGKADGSYDAQQQAEEEQLARRIREKQELVEREERENAAMWKHAIGPFGEGRKQEAVLPDPYVPTNSAQSDSKKDKDLITSETAASPSLTNGTNTQKVESYPWSTIPPSSRDGGEPNGFKMPETKEKSNLDANGEAKVSSRTKKREEVLRLQEEGEIGGPCDWSVGGKDGW